VLPCDAGTLRPRRCRTRSTGLSSLHLLGLWAFAIAEPLYEVLGRNREFFVAHRVTAVALLAYVALVSFVIPGIFALAITGLTALNRRAGHAAQFTAVGLLAAIVASEGLVKVISLPGVAHVGLALTIGAGIACAYAMVPLVATFVSMLSVGVVAFPVLFLIDPPMRPFLRPHDRTERAAVALGSTRPPIVFAVFDQLPLTSLLGDDDRIDAAQYPGFAALAADATWYRNASTAAALTGWAIPSIVTGLRASTDTLPTSSDFPDNLFTALAKGYRYEVEEPITDLCPDRLCTADVPPLPERLAAMLVDSAVVVAHVMTPSDFELLLPPLTEDWRNFVKNQVIDRRWVSERDQDRRLGPQQWLAGISGTDPQPTLYYLHALLPHEPYIYLPTGQLLLDGGGMPALTRDGDWANDEWAVAQIYQRHLLQVRYVDRLVGDLVLRLKQEGLWDRALVVVTADHGASFRAGSPFKEVDEKNVADIMSVPLFIKLPGQHGGSTSDRNVQSIDVLPTIADALDVELPWQTDGRSAFGDPQPPGKVIQYHEATRSRAIDTAELAGLRQEAVRRRLTLFDRNDPDLSPTIAVHRELIGQSLSALTLVDEQGLTTTLDHAERFRNFDPGASALNPRLDGIVRDATGAPVAARLAIAVNGVVRATTRTLDFEGSPAGRWQVLVAPRHFMKGANRVRVFVVKDARDGTVHLDEAFALNATVTGSTVN